MDSRNIFVYNSPEFLKTVGKKGTESDITIHHRKDGETITTLLEPSRYPEKLSSLTDAMYVADLAVINGDRLDREFGEVILTLDLMRKRKGFIYVSDDANRAQISKIIKGTALESYEFFTGTPMELMDRINGKPVERKESDRTVIIIDHFFKVKSVGSVALGFVLEGTLHRHDKLHLSDLDREVEVRSIQMHDVDQEKAPCGSRVGLNLKNIDADDLQRGMFMTSFKLNMSDTLKPPQVHPMIKDHTSGTMEVFVSDQLRYQRGFMKDGEIKLERKIPVYADSVLVTSPNLTPRVIGKSGFS